MGAKIKIIIFSLLFMLNIFAQDFEVVKVRGDALADGDKISVGDKLAKGVQITCDGKGSFVQFKSSAGSIFMLRNGILKLDRRQNNDSYLDLVRGKLYHVLNKGKTKEKVSIKTKQAVFGIRGTKYFIEVKDDQSYLCVCEGVVRAKDLRTLINTDVAANEDLYLYTNKDPEKKAANKMMIMMGADAFKEMGYPLK